MKKLLVLATALVIGATSFAHEGDKKCAKGKDCCKKKESKECCTKKAKDDKKATKTNSTTVKVEEKKAA
ncbi:MAG: hypothetical protein ACOVNY_01400 [Chitinophagaceae bacterium]